MNTLWGKPLPPPESLAAILDEWREIPERVALKVMRLREENGLTQVQLAKRAGVPRTTLTHLESGRANPSLQTLLKIAGALQVSIEELLTRPRRSFDVIRSSKTKPLIRSHGAGAVWKLLPDPIPGMELDRMDIEPGRVVKGVPHTRNTKEYLYCMKGRVRLQAGESVELHEGDLVAFPADQPHSYTNDGKTKASCLSVVVLAPIGI